MAIKTRMLFVAPLLLILLPQTAIAHIDIVWTHPRSSGFTLDERAVIDAAIEHWEQNIHDLGPTVNPPMIAVEIRSQILAADVLGFATEFVEEPKTQTPLSARIIINSAIDFYVDETPDDDSEFVLSAFSGSRFLASRNRTGLAAIGRHDLLSVTMHELGHVLGFSAGYTTWMKKVQNIDGVPFLVYDDEAVILAGGGDISHLSGRAYPHDLMSDKLVPGERYLPTERDLSILQGVYDYGRHLEKPTPPLPPSKSDVQIVVPLTAIILAATAFLLFSVGWILGRLTAGDRRRVRRQ